MEEPIFRPYMSGDEKGIVEALDKAFEGWPFYDIECTPVEHWQWLYLDNPYKCTIVGVAELNSRIIGASHSVPIMVKLRDDVLKSSYGTDAAVLPLHQGKGVVTRIRPIVDELRDKFVAKFHYGVAVNPIVIEYRKRLGYPPFPYDILVLERIYDVGLHIQMTGIKEKWRMKAKHYLNKLSTLMQPTTQKKADSKLEILDIEYFDERIDDFWNLVRDKYDFIVERTRDFLNWRYCDPRGGKYRVRLAVESGQPLGFSVLRVTRLKKYPVGYIVDLLALPERLDVAGFLADDAVSQLRAERVNVIKYQVVKGHTYEEIFKKLGFFESKDIRVVVYRWFSEEPDNLAGLNSHRVHFVYGDITGI
jgi:hypothetical protein